MFLEHQPTYVTEEKAAIGVVRIGVRFRKFVVNPVIPDPVED